MLPLLVWAPVPTLVNAMVPPPMPFSITPSKMPEPPMLPTVSVIALALVLVIFRKEERALVPT